MDRNLKELSAFFESCACSQLTIFVYLHDSDVGRLFSHGVTIGANLDKSEPNDTIGCGMFEDEDGKKIYFTKNGVMLVRMYVQLN